MDYTEKILLAIDYAKTLDDIDHIEQKLKTTEHINRRTLQGRKLTSQLLELTDNKAKQLIKEGATPF